MGIVFGPQLLFGVHGGMAVDAVSGFQDEEALDNFNRFSFVLGQLSKPAIVLDVVESAGFGMDGVWGPGHVFLSKEAPFAVPIVIHLLMHAIGVEIELVENGCELCYLLLATAIIPHHVLEQQLGDMVFLTIDNKRAWLGIPPQHRHILLQKGAFQVFVIRNKHAPGLKVSLLATVQNVFAHGACVTRR